MISVVLRWETSPDALLRGRLLQYFEDDIIHIPCGGCTTCLLGRNATTYDARIKKTTYV